MTDIESIFRSIRREVWIITAAHQDRRGGLTATWVSQASLDLDRPLLVVGLAVNHFTCELVEASGRFVAHLLSADQTDLAWQFASGSGRERDKFAGVDWLLFEDGVLILSDSPAWLECQVIDQHDTGDRRYFWADVVASGFDGKFEPLTDQQLFASGTREQIQAAKENMLSDIEIQKPLAEVWRQQAIARLNKRRS